MQIDILNDKFVEARDEIEYAEEDAETTYFNESHKAAKDAVGETMQLYQQVLNDLSDDDRGKLQRSMGMKMEQLKVQHCRCNAVQHLHWQCMIGYEQHEVNARLGKPWHDTSEQ